MSHLTTFEMGHFKSTHMNTQTYYGRIRLKSGGFPIQVSISATNNHAAKRANEAQYGSQFKSWDRQMSTQVY